VDSRYLLKLHPDMETYEFAQCCDLVEEARAIVAGV
jgi:hypothetical protein